MANRVHIYDEGRVDPGASEPQEFGRRVRELAREAHRVLGRPDGPIDELLRLHARVWHLLRDVPGARPVGVVRWLLAVRRQVGARLQTWSIEDLESLAG